MSWRTTNCMILRKEHKWELSVRFVAFCEWTVIVSYAISTMITVTS